MAEFRLPANSRVTKGKTHAAPGTASASGKVRQFQIYRYDPERPALIRASIPMPSTPGAAARWFSTP